MEEQTYLAVALSAGCGAWALWHFLRPLLRPSSGCDDCSGQQQPPSLLQIDPPEPKTPDSGLAHEELAR